MILFNTADICDKNDDIQIGDPIFKSYGKNKKFHGMIRTVIAIEDNSYVKKLVEEKVDKNGPNFLALFVASQLLVPDDHAPVQRILFEGYHSESRRISLTRVVFRRCHFNIASKI